MLSCGQLGVFDTKSSFLRETPWFFILILARMVTITQFSTLCKWCLFPFEEPSAVRGNQRGR